VRGLHRVRWRGWKDVPKADGREGAQKLAGYWNCYGETGNFRSLGNYWWVVLGRRHKWLN
jgi:hypothetical protein